jgi:hypothetical protein
MRNLAVALIAALPAVAAAAQAPAAYRAFENKLAPVTFQYPTAYEELPLPPSEQVLVARYVLLDQPAELGHLEPAQFTLARPRLFVFHFEPTGADKDGAPAGDPEPAAGRVGSFGDLLARLPGIVAVEDPRRPGFYTLRQEGADGGRLGFLVRRQQGGAEFGVYGFAPADYHRQLQAQLQVVGRSLGLTSAVAVGRATDEIDRIYDRSDLRFIAQRKRARGDLARGWAAVDTANYLIVHHGASAELLRRLARDLEAMRALYERAFPPAAPIERLAVVRVCRNRDEYHLYGGPKDSSGFWHPGNEELVLFDHASLAPKLDEAALRRLEKANVRLPDDDTLVVLYHEAFHQFIHYAVGEFPPHDWFNEGYGDHFAGARIAEATAQVQRIEANPWRWQLAREMCATGKDFVPLADLIGAEHATFYNAARKRFFYAAAWSFVHFLETDAAAKAHPQWSRILPTYFGVTKDKYAAALRRAGPEPTIAARVVAGFNARKAALQAAFAGVDMAALEQAWRRFGSGLKDPATARRGR